MRAPRQMKILSLLALGQVISCASPTIQVTSNPPGADVTIVSRDRQTFQVGKTPIDINTRQFSAAFADSSQIQVTREGHSPQMILFPKISALSGASRVNFNLEETTLPKVCSIQGEAINEIARGITEATANIQKKRYPEAVGLVQSLTTKYGTIPVLYDLLGNIYYLQRDFTKAIDAYKRSAALAPGNLQTQRMIERLQQLQGQSGG